MLAALVVAAAVAQGPPPAPTAWVEDHAGFLSAPTRDALDARLAHYQQATGHQVIVWIGTTLHGAPLDDWAVRTFAAWKLGRAGIDDGVAMFVIADDRAIDIEVGYGLEDRLPDVAASRIIREVMAPRLQAGQRDEAVTAGVDAVLAKIGSTDETRPAPVSTPELIGGGILLVIALIFFIKYPRTALAMLWFIGRSGGGGFNGGGGGFSGGGGRSGGGGARGKW